MRRIALVVVLTLLAGCIGNTFPSHPLRGDGPKVWWQADTAAITSNNPWEVYVPKNKVEEVAPLFPKDWKPAKISTKVSEERRLRKQWRIIKLRKKIKREKRLKKMRLDRLKKRSIIHRQDNEI